VVIAGGKGGGVGLGFCFCLRVPVPASILGQVDTYLCSVDLSRLNAASLSSHPHRTCKPTEPKYTNLYFRKFYKLDFKASKKIKKKMWM
jgi:hypothetical protein